MIVLLIFILQNLLVSCFIKFFFNDKLDYLINWLVDRCHCSKDWNEQSVTIRTKIQQAILDMPAHDEIKRLFASSCINRILIFINYFSC